MENIEYTNLNIRTNKNVKVRAEKIFNELGMNMTTAINLFLNSTIRENGIPFSLKLNEPNAATRAALEEADRIAYDKQVKGCKNRKNLRDFLDV